MLHAVEDTPNLAIHEYPSAGLFATVRQNLLTLDQATRVGRSAYCGGWGHPQEFERTNPFRKSWGSFRFLPGMTTLTTVVRVSGRQDGDTLRLYVNGSLVQSSSITANGDQTYTYTLTGLTNYAVVEVDWHIYNAGYSTPDLTEGQDWGRYEILDAWVSPVTLADAWPGVPTFTTVYDTATKVPQLANAVHWLVRRIGRRTDPLFTTSVRRGGPLSDASELDYGPGVQRWHGSVVTTATAPTLRARGQVWVRFPGATEEIRLYVNGSVVATSVPPATVGRYNWSFSYAMPQAAGSRVAVEIRFRRTAPALHYDNEIVSEWSLLRVWTEGAAGIYSAPSIPSVAARTDTTWSTWKAALNAAATLANTLKSRVDANPSLWSNQYLYRRSYAYNDYQEGVFEPNYIPTAIPRLGEALLIRGVGNKVAWGAQTFDEKSAETNSVGSYDLDATYSEAVNTDGTKGTSLVYLDALASLPPMASYNVRGGTIAYAAEIWRVGTDI